jgi:hypothetical protein
VRAPSVVLSLTSRYTVQARPGKLINRRALPKLGRWQASDQPGARLDTGMQASRCASCSGKPPGMARRIFTHITQNPIVHRGQRPVTLTQHTNYVRGKPQPTQIRPEGSLTVVEPQHVRASRRRTSRSKVTRLAKAEAALSNPRYTNYGAPEV